MAFDSMNHSVMYPVVKETVIYVSYHLGLDNIWQSNWKSHFMGHRELSKKTVVSQIDPYIERMWREGLEFACYEV